MIGLLFLNSYIHFFFFRYVNDDNNDYPFPDRNSVPLFIYKQKLNDISCMYIVRTRVYAAEQLGGRLESIALRVYEPNDKPNVKNQQNVCANSERLFIWSREIKNRIIRNTVTSFDSYRIFDQIKPEEKCENRLNNRTDQFCGFRKNKNFQLSNQILYSPSIKSAYAVSFCFTSFAKPVHAERCLSVLFMNVPDDCLFYIHTRIDCTENDF